jgi:hypothetical protein
MQLEEALELEQIAVPAWAWLVLVLSALAVYLVTLDNGFVLQGAASTAHELFHDTRHFIGVPCH